MSSKIVCLTRDIKKPIARRATQSALEILDGSLSVYGPETALYERILTVIAHYRLSGSIALDSKDVSLAVKWLKAEKKAAFYHTGELFARTYTVQLARK